VENKRKSRKDYRSGVNSEKKVDSFKIQLKMVGRLSERKWKKRGGGNPPLKIKPDPIIIEGNRGGVAERGDMLRGKQDARFIHIKRRNTADSKRKRPEAGVQRNGERDTVQTGWCEGATRGETGSNLWRKRGRGQGKTRENLFSERKRPFLGKARADRNWERNRRTVISGEKTKGRFPGRQRGEQTPRTGKSIDAGNRERMLRQRGENKGSGWVKTKRLIWKKKRRTDSLCETWEKVQH